MFGDGPAAAKAAKALCENCPLRLKCLGVALDNDISYGVWGATTFEERTHLCPICRHEKDPQALGCNSGHSLQRLARLIEQEAEGDMTVSVSIRSKITAATSPGCLQPRGRCHSSAKAYRQGCRCQASREALNRERATRPKPTAREERTPLERFMAFVEEDDAGHWWWRGSLNGSGYGNFWDGERTVRAHLFARRAFPSIAAEPCDSRLCVNPSHRHRRAA